MRKLQLSSGAQQVGVWLVLAAVVAIGGWLRISNLDWDGGYQLHPDERAILFVAQNIHWPIPPNETFDPRHSPLNPFRSKSGEPQHYAYGHIPLYFTVLAGGLTSELCSTRDWCRALAPESLVGRIMNSTALPPFDHLTYVGRTLSALADTLTIFASFLLARQLFNRWVGLLAASLTTTAVIHVQNAHFGTVDALLGLFCTLGVYFMVRSSTKSTWRNSLWAGIFTGLSTGSKSTGVLMVIPLIASHLVWREAQSGGGRRVALAHCRFLMASIGAAVLIFCVTNPYAILDSAQFIQNLAEQAGIGAGFIDVPFTRQYAGTIPIVYVVDQQARWMLGLPLTVAAYVGAAVAAFRLRHSYSGPVALTLLWIVIVLLSAGLGYAKYPRYMLPTTPALICFAASLFNNPPAVQPPDRREATRFMTIRSGLAFGLLIVNACYALAFFNMYREKHPWLSASEWLYRNLKPGSRIAVEAWDDALPLNVIQGGRTFQRDQVYTTSQIDFFSEPDDQAKLRTIATQLASSDTVIFSSNRSYGSIARLARRYPLSAATYRAMFASKLGFKMVMWFARYPNLLGVAMIDDPVGAAGLTSPWLPADRPFLNPGFADESVTVYDHPLVLIFMNQVHLTAPQMLVTILAGVQP